jgi:hypothetical protein
MGIFSRMLFEFMSFWSSHHLMVFFFFFSHIASSMGGEYSSDVNQWVQNWARSRVHLESLELVGLLGKTKESMIFRV